MLHCLLLSAAAQPAYGAAQEYPARPIRMIVTNAPGSAVDVLTRLVAPKRTSKPVLDKVRAALLKVLTHADVRDAMAEQATEVATSTPDEFRALVRNELVKYGEVVKAVGLKAD